MKTFDLDILTGPRPAGVLLDELHLLGKNAHAQKVIRQLRGGRQATPEGFLIILTTQSDEEPAGVFKEELMTARAVRDGKASGVMLPVLYEFPDELVQPPAPGCDPTWFDPKYWSMVLPNLGRVFFASTALVKALRHGANERRRRDPCMGVATFEHRDRGYRFGPIDGPVPIIGIVARTRRSISDKIMRLCDMCVVGIDGGGLDRSFSDWLLCWAARPRRNAGCIGGHAWAHRSVLDRRKDIASRLMDFEKDGDLTIVDRVGQDVQEVADIVQRLEDRRLLPWEKNAVGVDQIGILEIVEELCMRNIIPERISGVPQGFRLERRHQIDRARAGGWGFCPLRSALDGVGGRQLQSRTARQCNHHHEAACGICEDRSCDGAIRRRDGDGSQSIDGAVNLRGSPYARSLTARAG